MILEFVIIFIFATTLRICLGDFYKVQSHGLASLGQRVIYEDVFECDGREACRQFTRCALPSSNQPPKFDCELDIKFTKMPGKIIFFFCFIQ